MNAIDAPFLVLALRPGDATAGEAPQGYAEELWRPSLASRRPRGERGWYFDAWWLFHHVRVFRNAEYGVLIFRDGDVVAHRSVVFPPFFRFPFMAPGDLQVGYTFTAPEHRGRGLATEALRSVARRLGRPGRSFWYVVERDNVPSLRAAEAAGYRVVGRATRRARGPLGLLAAYELDASSDTSRTLAGAPS